MEIVSREQKVIKERKVRKVIKERKVKKERLVLLELAQAQQIKFSRVIQRQR